MGHLLPSTIRAGDHDFWSPHECMHHRPFVLEVMVVELKFKYWSVWVSLPYTMTCVLPSLLMFTQASRNGNMPSCSGSVVNLMLWSRLLRWVVNSSMWYSWITVNVSYTCLNHTEGWGWGLCGEQSRRILPYIGLLLWATLVIPWLLRVSVCISLPSI